MMFCLLTPDFAFSLLIQAKFQFRLDFIYLTPQGILNEVINMKFINYYIYILLLYYPQMFQ